MTGVPPGGKGMNWYSFNFKISEANENNNNSTIEKDPSEKEFEKEFNEIFDSEKDEEKAAEQLAKEEGEIDHENELYAEGKAHFKEGL